ncbi:MAG TPA: lecithin retinol acyltransferase family protein [Solirubrobacteraceae bacterium]
MSDMAGILQPGDELRVDRDVYHHHGLYVGDGVVIQLGGRIKDKSHASIHYASVSGFAKDASVKVVEHDQLDRAAAVRRAVWLLENPPPTTYNLLGYNCEHVARWCATGKIECRQAKELFTANSFMGAGVLLFVEHPHGWLLGLSSCSSASSFSGFHAAPRGSSNDTSAITGQVKA